MSIFEGNYGIKGLALEIIALIANDKKETITKIEDELKEGSIVNYLNDKYKEEFTNVFDESCPYDIQHWNKELSDFSGWIDGNESRKFGIRKEDDGLLLLLGLVLELLKEK